MRYDRQSFLCISVFLSGSISESVLEIRNPLTLEDRSVEFLIREPEFGILIRYDMVERGRDFSRGI